MCKHCEGWGSFPDHRERNAYDPEDEESPRYSHYPRKKSKSKMPKARGCSANDYGPHVYVIVEVRYWLPRHTMRDGSISPWKEGVRWERKCAGCGRVAKTYSKWQDPVGRYFLESDVYEVIQKDKGTFYWYY